ncbi:MAG: hypothetical protein ABIA75_12715 [Candidatus Neomarinimicrobiota bacterium]
MSGGVEICALSARAYFIFLLAVLLGVLAAQEQVAYFKYFRDDRAFLADNALLATSRNGIAHLEVVYGESGDPLFVTRYNQLGLATGHELYSYDNQRRLVQRAVLNEVKQVEKVIRYGADEAWSRAFREYTAIGNQNLAYTDQNSTFTFAANGRVGSIGFRTVDGTDYGRIVFQYDNQAGLLSESWLTLPDNKVVRLYRYQQDYSANSIRLTEYNRQGKMVSDVALAMAPADQLYKVPPPRTGNILDEVELIMSEIGRQKSQLPYQTLIPKTEWDRLVLKTGEELDINFIGLAGPILQFQRPGEGVDYSLPLEKVRLVVSRYGERLYP